MEDGVLRTRGCRQHADSSIDFKLLRCGGVELAIVAASYHMHRRPGEEMRAKRGMAICRRGRTAPHLTPYKVIAAQPPALTPNKIC